MCHCITKDVIGGLSEAQKEIRAVDEYFTKENHKYQNLLILENIIRIYLFKSGSGCGNVVFYALTYCPG